MRMGMLLSPRKLSHAGGQAGDDDRYSGMLRCSEFRSCCLMEKGIYALASLLSTKEGWQVSGRRIHTNKEGTLIARQVLAGVNFRNSCLMEKEEAFKRE